MVGSWRLSRKRLVWIVAILGFFAAVTVARGVPFTPWPMGIVLRCFCCQLVDSSPGMGYGTALTPILLAFGWSPFNSCGTWTS